VAAIDLAGWDSPGPTDDQPHTSGFSVENNGDGVAVSAG